jgi:hypothetical protein
MEMSGGGSGRRPAQSKAIEAAGQEVDRFEFGPDGKMAVFTRKRGERAPAPSKADDIVARLK